MDLEPSNLESRFSASFERSSSARHLHEVAPTPSTRSRHGHLHNYPSPASQSTATRTPSLPPPPPSLLSRPPLPSSAPGVAAVLPAATTSMSMSAGVLLAHRVASMRKERKNQQATQ